MNAGGGHSVVSTEPRPNVWHRTSPWLSDNGDKK